MKPIFSLFRLLFAQNQKEQDFSKFFGDIPQTRKQKLLQDCKKNDVSIYIDNPSEQSSGIYAELRGVASETELEQRLNAKKAIGQSNQANMIAVIALIVSILALVKSFL